MFQTIARVPLKRFLRAVCTCRSALFYFEVNEKLIEPVTAKCYLFSIYFVLQTNRSQTIYTFSVVLFRQFHYMYAVILTTFKDFFSKGAELTGAQLLSNHKDWIYSYLLQRESGPFQKQQPITQGCLTTQHCR